jgi:23S rRNA pseudouridine1911/1915/1917 synthase
MLQPEAAPLAFQVEAAEAGWRLDRFLAGRAESLEIALSRTRLKALVEAGAVAIDGIVILDAALKMKAGQDVELVLPPPEDPVPRGENIPLVVVYEDAHLLVLDKPAGLVVHPAPGHASGTLVNALIAHCGDSLSGIGGVRRPGIVHRLDKNTTGLMVVAKTDRAHASLSRQFADHGRSGVMQRGYLAFGWGVPERPKGTIEAPIGRHRLARDKMAVRPEGRQAVTHWEILERYAGSDGSPVASLLACRLMTGRTHQIRVHLASIGHPLLGDDTYGSGFRTKTARLPPEARQALAGLGRQALHAYLLGVEHPSRGEYLEFRSELPGDLSGLRSSLGAQLGPSGASGRVHKSAGKSKT